MADICYISTEMETPFDLLLISPEQDLPNELKITIELFSLGIGGFHLRKPHWAIEQVQHFLETIPKEHHHKIVLHSHFQLAHLFQVKGIHLNETNKKLIHQFEKYPVLSASFHSLNELKENTFRYEYVFLSPIFNSISKGGYHAKFDLKLLSEELNRMKQENHLLPKVIALGGIDSENILNVKEAGFAGAALLGAVWQSENPAEILLKIRSVAAQ